MPIHSKSMKLSSRNGVIFIRNKRSLSFQSQPSRKRRQSADYFKDSSSAHKRPKIHDNVDLCSPLPVEDSQHYNFVPGEQLNNRYDVLRELGLGTFGRVLDCWDRELHREVAVKIIRNNPKSVDDALIESDILKKLLQIDPDAKSFVSLIDTFYHRGYFCLVFERLGPSLFSLLKTNGMMPFAFPLVRSFARELLRCIAFLHDDAKLIHTDLKPENVLLVSDQVVTETVPGTDLQYSTPMSTQVKVIDLGSSIFDRDHHARVIQTRSYRAPEVTLGLDYSFPADIWSVGCILYDLFSGETLFRARDETELVALVEQTCGPFPRWMLESTRKDNKSSKYFHSDGSLRWPSDPRQKEDLRELLRRQQTLSELVASPRDHMFLDLLKRLLEIDPEKRITAKDALSHPFFDEK